MNSLDSKVTELKSVIFNRFSKSFSSFRRDTE